MQWLLKNHEAIKNIGQALAWLAAAFFFIWKVAGGYSVINMSVALKAQRFHRNADRDRLKVRLELTKGDRASLLLKDIVLRCTADASTGAVVDEQRIDEISRLNKQLSNTLRLTPGEATHFERAFEIPADAVARIDVRIQGKSFFRGQWRASVVSVPEDREASQNG
jgi:hypothetical protein